MTNVVASSPGMLVNNCTVHKLHQRYILEVSHQRVISRNTIVWAIWPTSGSIIVSDTSVNVIMEVIVKHIFIYSCHCINHNYTGLRVIGFCVESFSYTPLAVLCGEFLLHIQGSFMYGGFLTASSLLSLEGWQANGRTRSVGWSLRTMPQIKQVSVVMMMM